MWSPVVRWNLHCSSRRSCSVLCHVQPAAGAASAGAVSLCQQVDGPCLSEPASTPPVSTMHDDHTKLLDSADAQQPLLSPASTTGSSALAKRTMGGELGKLAALTLPLVFQNLCTYMVPLVSLAFVGHLNAAVLSSVVLATSFFNITGNSVMVGLSAGMETLCGQAHGARNYKMLGLVLQRALLVCSITAVPIIALWFNLEAVLTAMQLAPEVAAGASRYLAVAWPALFAIAVTNVLNWYLLAQEQAAPSTVCSVVSALLCPLYNWLFLFRLQLGLEGAAYANMLSQGTTSVLLVLYVVYRDTSMLLRKDPRSTWPGWQITKALEPKAVLQYLWYGGPSVAMICLEWWAFELLIVLSGTLKQDPDVAVSTMGVSLLINGGFYLIPISVGMAVNTRVANELGAGHAWAARAALFVAIGVVLMFTCCCSALIWVLRDRLAVLFTNDSKVQAMVSSVGLPMCFGVIGDGLNAVFGGALRGSGRQGLGAVLNLVSWWLLVVPLAVYAGFNHGLGVWGFWLALAGGSVFQSMVFLVTFLRFDWEHEVDNAKKLVATHPQDADRPSADHADVLTEPLIGAAV